MRFKYKRDIRYSIDCTEEEFVCAQTEYYHHLASLNFSRKQALLRYFGESFFHDGTILEFRMYPQRRELVLEIASTNTLEDLNAYRTGHNMLKIPEREFWDRPISYCCTFRGVGDVNINIDLSDRDCIWIMDTEIAAYDAQIGYLINIPFDEEKEISFYTGGVRVTVDPLLVSHYTGGRRNTIPYCRTCQSRLLTVNRLLTEAQ